MSANLQKFYDKLLKIDIHLDERRMDEPYYVKSKRIEVQHLLSLVDRLSLQVTQLISKVETDLTRERFEYNVKKNNALTQNQQIKQLPSQREREAAVEVLYEEDLRRVLEKENGFISHKHVKEAIRDRRQVLAGARSTIVDAIKLIETEARGANVGAPSDPDVKDLYKSLSEVEREEEALNKEVDLDDVEDTTEEVEASEGPVEAEQDYEIDIEDDKDQDLDNIIEPSPKSDGPDVEIEEEESQAEAEEKPSDDTISRVDLSEVEGESSAQTGDQPDTGEDSQVDGEASGDSDFDIESLFMQDDEDELSASGETEDTEIESSDESVSEETRDHQHNEAEDGSIEADISDVVGDALDVEEAESSDPEPDQESSTSTTKEFDLDFDISEEDSEEKSTEESPDEDLESLIATEEKPKSKSKGKPKATSKGKSKEKEKTVKEDDASISESGIDIDDILNDIDI